MLAIFLFQINIFDTRKLSRMTFNGSMIILYILWAKRYEYQKCKKNGHISFPD